MFLRWRHHNLLNSPLHSSRICLIKTLGRRLCRYLLRFWYYFMILFIFHFIFRFERCHTCLLVLLISCMSTNIPIWLLSRRLQNNIRWFLSQPVIWALPFIFNTCGLLMSFDFRTFWRWRKYVSTNHVCKWTGYAGIINPCLSYSLNMFWLWMISNKVQVYGSVVRLDAVVGMFPAMRWSICNQVLIQLCFLKVVIRSQPRWLESVQRLWGDDIADIVVLAEVYLASLSAMAGSLDAF